MPNLPVHNRIKPKASAKAAPAEREFHKWVMDHGCLVCGGDAVFHHLMQPTPNKRGRRDHLIGVSLCHTHHSQLHDKIGDEIKWQAMHRLDLAKEAEINRASAMFMGII